MMFPKVRPDFDKGWSMEKGLFLTGRPAGDPDASFLACGITSKILTGKHARTLIGDDIHDRENSSSSDACMRVKEFYYKQLIGRADPRGARFIIAGRRWHADDIYGHLARSGEYVVMVLPAIRENSRDLYWDVTVPAGVECVFTEMLREGPSHKITADANSANVKS